MFVTSILLGTEAVSDTWEILSLASLQRGQRSVIVNYWPPSLELAAIQRLAQLQSGTVTSRDADPDSSGWRTICATASPPFCLCTVRRRVFETFPFKSTSSWFYTEQCFSWHSFHNLLQRAGWHRLSSPFKWPLANKINAAPVRIIAAEKLGAAAALGHLCHASGVLP